MSNLFVIIISALIYSFFMKCVFKYAVDKKNFYSIFPTNCYVNISSFSLTIAYIY